MKFRVKEIKIRTNDPTSIFFNPKDLEKLGFSFGKRLAVFDENKNFLFFGNAFYGLDLKEGEIGLQTFVIEKYNIKDFVIIGEKENEAVSLIEKKLKGNKLYYSDFKKIFDYIMKGWLSPMDIAYFTASFINEEYDEIEAYDLTKAMVDTGEKLEWDDIILNKHSIGGIPNNRISPFIVSLVAEWGYKIPKISSRAITSPAGTADTMEVFMNVNLSLKEIKKIVEKVNGVLAWGGATNIAPIDDVLIRYRRDYNLDPLALVLSSILSKHVAVGSKYMVYDLPYGPTAKLKSFDEANNMYIYYSSLAKKFGIEVKPFYTYNLQPVGNGIGPALEAIDILRIFKRDEKRPKDLEEKALRITTELLYLVEKENLDHRTEEEIKKDIYDDLYEILDSRKAFKRFKKIAEAQGLHIKDFDEKYIKLSEYILEIKSPKNGIVKEINNKLITKITRLLGNPANKEVGIYLEKKVGDKVNKGDVLMKVYLPNEEVKDNILNYINKILRHLFIIKWEG